MEIWREIKGYEGIYEISSIGRARSLDRKDANGYKRKGAFLKPRVNRGGYKQVALCKQGNLKTKLIHRLVAQAFIKNPKDLPQVGHMNDIKTDNSIGNLYWTNAKENNIHNGRHLRYCKKIKGVSNDNEIIFNSLVEAKANGFNKSSIGYCLIGRCKTHKGYKWERL